MTFVPGVDDKKTAFGELEVAQMTPVIQMQWPYNINTEIVNTRPNQSGTVTQASSMIVVQSGAAANSGATLLSHHEIKYNPGQGVAARFTALFTTGVANSSQIAGIGTIGDGFFVGYDGTAFGFLHRFGGHPEVQTVTITSGAVTGNGDITINLDGQATTVAVLLNDTAREVAVKIADTSFADAGGGWTATVNNATVVFVAWTDGDKSGTMSLVDTDTTGAAGTFAETVTGVATTNTWIPQTTWNEDKFDGNGGSSVTLDPTKGNVYEIEYQWLGFGLITLSVEDPKDGLYHHAHTIRYANANTTPSIQNPTLPLHIASINTSNTSNLTIKSGSMAGFVQGENAQDGILLSASNTISNLSNSEVPILSIKNRVIHQGLINRSEIKPEILTLATEATKPVIFRVRETPTLTGTPAFAALDATNSLVDVDIAATGVSGGEAILTVVLGKADSKVISVHELNRHIEPGETLVVTAEGTTSGSQDATVGFNWTELI